MKLLVSLLLILFSGVNVFAQNASDIQYVTLDSVKEGSVVLENWRFKQGDDSSYSFLSYDQSTWQIVDPEFNLWDEPKFANSLKSIVWFRKYIHIDSGFSSIPVSLKMNHFGASDIFVDGKKTVSYGHINAPRKTKYERPIVPLIITLGPGTHLIAVRYANYNFLENYTKYDESTAGFELRINRSDRATEGLYKNTSVTAAVFIFFFAFFLAFFLLHMFVFFLNRQEKANLYFCIFCLALSTSFLWLFFAYVSTSPTPSLTLRSALFIIPTVMSVALSGFLNTLFGSLKIRFRIIVLLAIVSIVLWLTLHNAYAVGIVIIIICMEGAFLIVRALFRETSGAVLIGIGLLIFTTCIFMVVFNAVYNNADINLSGGIGIALVISTISLPVSMSIYLSRNYSAINKNLKKQLVQVETLSEKTIQQELEKQRLLENRQEELEHEVAERTSELLAQKQKSDDLLLNILPEEVAEELKEKGTSAAKHFDHVSVLFTDFVDFTKAGERLTPQQLVDELHACFMKFDEICSKYNIEKIKTIGDAYLAVSGLPLSDKEHAVNITKAAIEIRNFIAERKLAHPDTSFNIRIGIHSGSVVAGIVGVKKFAYDIWGDTVNTAARMEQSSESGKINISEFTYELIKDRFNCTFRGQITAKSKGAMNMYFVEGES